MTTFAWAVFAAAFLLFQVQPLIGKFILPWFGGGPAVWTTCLLFFQILLLGGYAYAHLLTRWFNQRTQAVIHLALVAAALASLPIIPGTQWKPAGLDDPTWRILALLAATVGLPYLVLSATGPLIQQWFTRASPGASPYRLYALSNVGSLLALVTYPFLVEPLLSRQTQAAGWSCGLGFYAVLTVLCAAKLWRAKAISAPAPTGDRSLRVTEPPSPPAVKLLWLLLPACASVLLLATTNKLCLDVAVIPFLWVLPLGLYLLSFILCFEGPRGYWRKFYGVALAVSLGLVCLAWFQYRLPLRLQIVIYAWALFNGCMVCHGELYRLKPHPRHLTGFYLTIAAGGAVGGLFVAVVAPGIFHDYWELHCGLGLLALLLAVVHWRERSKLMVGAVRLPVWGVTAAGACLLAAALFSQPTNPRNSRLVASARNFYGGLKVFEVNRGDPAQHALLLQSGITLHGIQMLEPALRQIPVSYFHEGSGIGRVLRRFPRQENRRIGVVGLGVGTLAAYGRRGDVIRFYEINPEVRRLAEERFSYLAGTAARVEIVMGDGRLALEREPSQRYDVLVLDAFSSDAIPVHLLTREAFEVYLRHLKPDGVLAVQITNRHLDLAPVLDRVAEAFQLDATDVVSARGDQPWWILPPRWYLLSRNRDRFNHPDFRGGATERKERGRRVALWTDDYASLYPLLK